LSPEKVGTVMSLKGLVLPLSTKGPVGAG
jgi:hypothetical protein